MKQTNKVESQSEKRVNHTRRMVMTAILSALSSVLMFFSFNVPLMPSFIKMDLSELPALIAAFSMGPIYGAIVCLVKNLVNLLTTTTGGVGELSNFILGVFFVVPAGIIYKLRPKFSGAIIGSIAGAAMMALLSVFSNYYVVYPIYTLSDIHRVHADGSYYRNVSGDQSFGKESLAVSANFQYAVYIHKGNGKRGDHHSRLQKAHSAYQRHKRQISISVKIVGIDFS